MTGRRHVVEGGVIVRHHRADGTFYLVIRRDDDWSLPKGHSEPGDATLLATATRELEEEAGVRCAIDGPGGVFTYETGDERRSVHFFTGTYDGPVSTDKELDGVSQTLWLRREAAAQRLTYDDLREFFLQATAPAPARAKASWWQRHDVRLDRLASAIDVFQVEVHVLGGRSSEDGSAAAGPGPCAPKRTRSSPRGAGPQRWSCSRHRILFRPSTSRRPRGCSTSTA